MRTTFAILASIIYLASKVVAQTTSIPALAATHFRFSADTSRCFGPTVVPGNSDPVPVVLQPCGDGTILDQTALYLPTGSASGNPNTIFMGNRQACITNNGPFNAVTFNRCFRNANNNQLWTIGSDGRIMDLLTQNCLAANGTAMTLLPCTGEQAPQEIWSPQVINPCTSA